MSLNLHFSYQKENLVNTLQDIVVRFIINCPQQDLDRSERLFFQIEEAQWFYEDFVRVQNPSVPSLKMRPFVEQLFKCCPILSSYSKDPMADLAKFSSYKSVIPVCGAIILNDDMTKALMVKGWKGSSWGFPKGKISKDEPYYECAVREVYEEIGFDISPYLKKEDYAEETIKGKKIRLYIVRGVPLDSNFQPQTRKEISKIQWHDVKKLPAFSKRSQTTESSHYYFMVAPFMGTLKKYISKAKGLASSLTQSESDALKNILGVSQKANIEIEDNDEAAKQLLSLLKSNSSATATAATSAPTGTEPANAKSDRNILLDLLHQGPPRSEAQELENAREILNLLQNKISEETIGQQQPLPQPQFIMPPPMPLPYGFPPLPPYMVPPPIGPNGLPIGPPPPMLPMMSNNPISAAQFSSPSNSGSENQGNTSDGSMMGSSSGGSSGSVFPDYSAPSRPPPPNPILLSLLASKHKRANNTGNDFSEGKVKGRSTDPLAFNASGRGEKMPLRLADLFKETSASNSTSRASSVSEPNFAGKAGGAALLSLLDSPKPPRQQSPVNSVTAVEAQLRSESTESASADSSTNNGTSLLHLLNPSSGAATTPAKSRGGESVEARSLLGLLGESAAGLSSSNSQEKSVIGQPFPSGGNNTPRNSSRTSSMLSASGNTMMDLLNPTSARGSESPKPSPSPIGTPKTAPGRSSNREMSSLLSLLGHPLQRSSESPVSSSIESDSEKEKETEKEKEKAKDIRRQSSLMDLLTQGSSPISEKEKTSQLHSGVIGDDANLALKETSNGFPKEAHKSNGGQLATGRSLLDLLSTNDRVSPSPQKEGESEPAKAVVDKADADEPTVSSKGVSSESYRNSSGASSTSAPDSDSPKAKYANKTTTVLTNEKTNKYITFLQNFIRG